MSEEVHQTKSEEVHKTKSEEEDKRRKYSIWDVANWLM